MTDGAKKKAGERGREARTDGEAGSAKVAKARAALREALALARQAREKAAEVAVALSDVDRNESPGKLRVGEASVLGDVLDAADRHPPLTAAHADSDGGVDPARFETELLREWLELNAAFSEAASSIGDEMGALVRLLGDSAMFYGARVRKPTLRVYKDLSALALHDPKLREELRDPIAYYGDIARKGARTRAKSQKA